MDNDSSIKKFHSKIMCKVCQQETWHTVLNMVEKRDSYEESGFWEITTFLTLQCLGCENVCLLIEYIFSEDIDPITGDPEIQRSINPSPYKNDRELIDKLYHVPKKAQSVYKETIKAFNFNMMILAAIGIRSTIEAIAIEQKITVQGIAGKIKKMVEQKIITPDGAKLLCLVRDMGNLATHEIKKHHHDDLALCIDIIEDIFRSLYILPAEAENTRKILDGKWTRV